MKKCDKCNIEIETNQLYCPLCHQVLTGETDPDFKEVYPEYISLTRKILPTTKKALLISMILSIIILGLVNVLSFKGSYWSLVPIGSILYFWFVVRIGVLSRRNVAFRLAFLTTLLIGLLILIDFRSFPDNNGWAVDYLMPILLFSCNLAISVIIWIKRLNYRDYFFYLLIVIIFSLVPIILVVFDVIKVMWPSVVAFGVAIFILLFLVVFYPKSIKEEIKKRFHA
jgi:CDP-diglyceride synthetase